MVTNELLWRTTSGSSRLGGLSLDDRRNRNEKLEAAMEENRFMGSINNMFDEFKKDTGK